MAFPYAKQSSLERKLDISAASYGLSDGEWTTLLQETLETESARVEGESYADHRWRDTGYAVDDVPRVVRDAVIRLSVASIHEIDAAGLESENTGDGASYNYRPSSKVMAEVREELAQHDFPPDQESGADDPTIRSDLI